jgi:hypothetical protein
MSTPRPVVFNDYSSILSKTIFTNICIFSEFFRRYSWYRSLL